MPSLFVQSYKKSFDIDKNDAFMVYWLQILTPKRIHRTMKKAIIFDLDGTLADSIPAITEGINRAMRQLGYPDRSEEEVRSFINYGARHLIRCAIPREYWDDDAAIDHALEVYHGTYGEVVLLTNTPYRKFPLPNCRLQQPFVLGVG